MKKINVSIGTVGTILSVTATVVNAVASNKKLAELVEKEVKKQLTK